MLQAGRKFAELAGRRKQPSPQRTQGIAMPSQQGGINALNGVSSDNLRDALYMDNLIPAEYGNAVRKGYREWCPPIPNGDGIKTIIPFNSRLDDLTDISKLFAVTSDGIYDITVANVAPVRVLEWPNKSTRAGWVSWTNYVTVAGPFLLLCDLQNGYYVYNGTTNTWTPGDISGPSPAEATLDFVTVFKNRVWLVQQDSGTAWFLQPGAISGAAEKFEFGNKFKYGGYLKAMYNWTLDGGQGIDDYLVAISDAGDMVIYQGEDPKTVGKWEMRGVYFLGKSPRNRRIGSEFGGDLLLLSTYGIMLASKLVAGMPLGDSSVSITAKINSRLNDVMQRTLNEFGWEMKLFPREQLMLVIMPKEIGVPYQQYVYNIQTQGWCRFVGVPIKTAEVFRGDLFMGSQDNRIFRYEGYADNVLLEDNGESSYAVDWQLLTMFSSYGGPSFKRVQFIRPQFLAGIPPAFFVEARYDFDIERIPNAPPYVGPGTTVWDTGIWDVDQWGGGYTRTGPPIGTLGMGRHIAIALRGRSNSETVYVGCDVMLESGGLL